MALIACTASASSETRSDSSLTLVASASFVWRWSAAPLRKRAFCSATSSDSRFSSARVSSPERWISASWLWSAATWIASRSMSLLAAKSGPAASTAQAPIARIRAWEIQDRHHTVKLRPQKVQKETETGNPGGSGGMESPQLKEGGSRPGRSSLLEERSLESHEGARRTNEQRTTNRDHSDEIARERLFSRQHETARRDASGPSQNARGGFAPRRLRPSPAASGLSFPNETIRRRSWATPRLTR